ncbi:MAG: VWA domain-containing protein, partial [Ruminococcus sp.]|nr:VWA domain-containing protein [Ruminococcus sp.]
EEEIEYKTGINDKDSDGDMLSDNEEINQYKTDPLKIDTDGDLLSDGEEVILGLNPLRKKTDGKTLDSKRLFKQSLSASRIESKLIKKSSPAIPSLTGTVSGLIDKHISIVSVDVYALKDNTAVVGVPVYVKSDYGKDCKLKLKFDCSNSGYDAKVLTISKYDNGKIKHCKTKQADGILSTTVTEGIYYVTNINIQLENLGINIADGLKGEALKKYNKSKNLASVGSGNDITNGSADIVFVVDTTGSMDKILSVVSNKFDDLVDSLGGNAVNKRFAILKFKDAEFNEKPELIKNGDSNWFTTQESIKNAFKTIKVSGGVDAGETVIDSLQKAQLLDFRGSANKRIILITDSYYKGSADSMHSLAENLADSGITTSIITDKNYADDYKDLADTTLGTVTIITADDYNNTFENIDEKPAGDVEATESTSPTQSTTSPQQPSETTQPTTPSASEPTEKKEYWVVLSDYQCVKLNGPVSMLSIVDTDGDGLKDFEELGGNNARTTVVLRDYIKQILAANGLPESEYSGKSSIYVYNYISNPVLPDTDFDGLNDNIDDAKKNNYFTGKLATEYAKTSGGNSVEFNMDYRWFFNSSKSYNNELSKMSLLYASAVYHENSLKVVNSNNSTVTNGTTIKELMGSFGLSNAHNYYLGPKNSIDDITERNMYDNPENGYNPVNDEHMSEVALGHRTVTYNGKTKTILAVTVRGTNGTLSEWQSNFDVGDYNSNNSDWKNKNHHKGFDIAANRIMKIISAYCTAYNVDSSNICYWITGHSRGAGISNLLGAYYADKGAETFTYTFAAPAALRDLSKATAKRTIYNSIFNVVNKDDFVPCLPMERWYYTLYGKTSKVSLAENSAYESQWEKMSGIFDYNPPSQKTLDGVCDALAEIIINENANSYNKSSSVDARYACYNMSCAESHTHSNDLLSSNGWASKGSGDGSWDKITITNRGVSASSRAGALEKIPVNARPYCGINYVSKLLASYSFENCQTPAYFMQILAAMMGGEISAYRFAVELDIADRYETAKTQIVYGAIAGITHPHYTESYYVLADNIKAETFS